MHSTLPLVKILKTPARIFSAAWPKWDRETALLPMLIFNKALMWKRRAGRAVQNTFRDLLNASKAACE